MLNGRNDASRLSRLAWAARPELELVSAIPRQRHILVPTSLAAGDRAAVLLGMQLGWNCQSTLTLLRVLPPQSAPSAKCGLDALDHLFSASWHPNERFPPTDGLGSIESSRAELMAFLAREIPANVWPFMDVRAECRTGDVANEIVRFADVAAVDLVILSSELSSWGLPILPAQTRRILRLTRKPVVLVRPDSRRRTVSSGSAELDFTNPLRRQPTP